MSLIVLSGGFDPVHVGHIRMIQEAARRYDRVGIILNSDAWLTRKKGSPFMCWDERHEVMSSIVGVSFVTGVDDRDGSVCSALRLLRPDAFGNGGDRTASNTPEMKLCDELSIDLVWGLGGGKVQSSSDLTRKFKGIPLQE